MSPQAVGPRAQRSTWADAVEAPSGGRLALRLDAPLTVRQAERHAPWHPGRGAPSCPVDEELVIGHAGELHPRAVQALGLPERTVVDRGPTSRPLFAAAPRLVEIDGRAR